MDLQKILEGSKAAGLGLKNQNDNIAWSEEQKRSLLELKKKLDDCHKVYGISNMRIMDLSDHIQDCLDHSKKLDRELFAHGSDQLNVVQSNALLRLHLNRVNYEEESKLNKGTVANG